MRIAIITFTYGNLDKSKKMVAKLERVSIERGNQVEVIDGLKDLSSTRLTIFDYIAVLYKSSSFIGAKMPSRISEFLGTSGTIAGKKGCALIVKNGLSSEKQCKAIMRIMEAEGLKLDYFDVIQDIDHCASVGKKIG